MVSIPRLVVAAAASGQGKTSITSGLLAAFVARGLSVCAHKVGPDYIDPTYHAIAAGRPGRNLDPWLVGEELIAPLFLHGARTPTLADIAVIEGVMGLYDGAYGQGEFASTAHVAKLLKAPVLLVVDAAATGRSVAAVVHGFATFDPQVRIGGVILNRVGSDRHELILREALAEVGVPVLGAVRRHDALVTPSRHLGLVPAPERARLARETVSSLGEVIGQSVDLDAVLRLARTAPDLPDQPWSPDRAVAPLRPLTGHEAPVVAIAGGPAFTFTYAETTDLLGAAGAAVRWFDPLRTEELPDNVAGIIIGGGFPEVHAHQLSANVRLRTALRRQVARGAVVAAECAGLLYLAQSLDGLPMCGVLQAQAQMTPRLTIGYRDAVAPTDSLLACAGTQVRGHEFHRTTTTLTDVSTSAWRWRAGDRVVDDGFATAQLHASYLHLHWAGSPELVTRFVRAAQRARGTVMAGEG